ncbi:MAG: glycosyltransferase [Clostridia bacterium]|nr:glycosyltransferase [Clostridia bacterium]
MSFERILPPNSRRRIFLKKIYSKIVGYSDEERRYFKWIKQNEPTKEELEKQRNTEFEKSPKISIIVPVYNTPKKFFDELVKSLENQTYRNWELCLADGSPTPLEFMEEYLKDSRIKYKIIGENKGISGNTNEALSLATGEYIGLLDHDDLLPVFSLYEVVKAINENPEVEFLYSDEDKLETAKGPRYGAFFKPDFSPYTLNSANYICHFSVFKKELMDKLGGFRSEYDGSQDFDIVARASELTKNIVHIPKILYHWRAHRNSTAQNADSKPYAFEVGKKVIHSHIQRSLDTEVEVLDGLTPGSYEIKYKVKGKPKVSLIVDSKEPEKVIPKLKVATYENYEIVKVENGNLKEAIENCSGQYFMIVDDNLIKIDRPSFIEDLVGICQDKAVGMVGTKLYDEKELVLHAGIVLGMRGTGDFLYQGVPQDIGTYMQRLLIIHNVSCVYLRYAMIDKDVYQQVGGVSKAFSGINQSIDFSIGVLNLGLQVVLNPIISFKVKSLKEAEKVQEEEAPLKKKWEKFYDKGDIYFSPNLSKEVTGLTIDIR